MPHEFVDVVVSSAVSVTVVSVIAVITVTIVAVVTAVSVAVAVWFAAVCRHACGAQRDSRAGVLVSADAVALGGVVADDVPVAGLRQGNDGQADVQTGHWHVVVVNLLREARGRKDESEGEGVEMHGSELGVFRGTKLLSS